MLCMLWGCKSVLCDSSQLLLTPHSMIGLLPSPLGGEETPGDALGHACINHQSHECDTAAKNRQENLGKKTKNTAVFF